MLRTLILFSACFMSSLLSIGQSKKIDIQLRTYLRMDHPPGHMVDLFVHGEIDAVSAAVMENGGKVKMALPGLVSVRVPVASVEGLANSPAVRGFEFSMEPGRLMNDSMRVKNRVDLVHAGLAPLPQAYTGNGVITGFIDSGLDVTHPDLRTADGDSRVIRYWDQNVSNGPAGVPAQFGYGSEWTTEDLGLEDEVPSDAATGHGSTVVGTASGNALANGRHKGVAPDADIVVVAADLGAGNFRAKVADAVAYILSVAETEGKPVVINASLGSYSGSHDGKDAAALFIEQLLNAQGGRAMVAACGNSNGNYPYHTETTVDSDTSFTWYTTNENGPQFNIFPFPNLYFEVWADLDQMQNVQFAIGADRRIPTLAYRGRTAMHSIAEVLDGPVVEPLISSSGNTLGTVEFFAQERGEQVLLQVFMQEPDSASYMWRFMSTGSGQFDSWTLTTYTATSNVIGPMLAAPLGLPFPSAVDYPDMEHYVEPDHRKHIVDSWTCLDNVVTVANYCNEVSYIDYAGNTQTVPGVEGNIANNSSSGPTRDGRIKPDIAASGDITMTTLPLASIQWLIENQNGWKVDPGGMHSRNGGTSIAAPVVAGTAALYLERCPSASAMEIVRAVRANAWEDPFTGSLPNDRWGMGKLDAFRTVLNRAELLATTTSLCPGEEASVSAPDQFVDAVWSDGGSGLPYSFSGGGELSATMLSAAGCVGLSDTLQFELLEAPEQPTITLAGLEMTSSSADGYQWYLDGEPIEGATMASWTAQVPGSYTVEVYSTDGCSALSEPELIPSVGVEEMERIGLGIWPNPTSGRLMVQMPEGTNVLQLRLTGADGRLLRNEIRVAIGQIEVFDLSGLAAGTYMLHIEREGLRWSERLVKLP